MATSKRQKALEYLKRFKADQKAGHSAAADYWQGAAAAMLTANPSKSLLAETVHPNGQHIDYYRRPKGMMQQTWREFKGRPKHVRMMPQDWLNGLLMDTRSIGGQVIDHRDSPNPVAASPNPAGKEPWMMTKAEYIAGVIDRSERIRSGYWKGNRLTLKGITKWELERIRTVGAPRAHAHFVRTALEMGKPVPPEVLADYPELKRNPLTALGQVPAAMKTAQIVRPMEHIPRRVAFRKMLYNPVRYLYIDREGAKFKVVTVDEQGRERATPDRFPSFDAAFGAARTVAKSLGVSSFRQAPELAANPEQPHMSVRSNRKGEPVIRDQAGRVLAVIPKTMTIDKLEQMLYSGDLGQDQEAAIRLAIQMKQGSNPDDEPPPIVRIEVRVHGKTIDVSAVDSRGKHRRTSSHSFGTGKLAAYQRANKLAVYYGVPVQTIHQGKNPFLEALVTGAGFGLGAMAANVVGRARNPRPPKGWWTKMRRKMTKQYPRLGKRRLDEITAGIWWGYPAATRERLLAEYEG